MLSLFAVLALVVVTSPAAAQDGWPSKPITVIVPFGAGGNTDGLARIYSARLSARLGQQFVIENRVGAGSIIGITSLAKAAPDGYTIGIGTSAGLAINSAILKGKPRLQRRQGLRLSAPDGYSAQHACSASLRPGKKPPGVHRLG